MTDTLADIKPGNKAQVIDITGGKSNSRLLDMGIIPGTEIKVTAVHPFKGPVVVEIDGSQVAIGRRIAQLITVRALR
ncbi:MAG: FeoA family protein [Methylocystaceae bacterium]